MLESIGVSSFEDLLRDLPADERISRPLRVPGPLSEIEVRRRFGAWAQSNDVAHAASFLGGGVYDHYIPAAVNAIGMRPEFATAYTPYQPEVAQGTLTAIFEFQSMIVELTGCAVANASLYDGGTAVCEAALLARTHTGRKRIVVAGAVHPHIADLLRTYLENDVQVIADRNGLCSLDDLGAALGPEVAAVIYQHPNFLGLLESPGAIHDRAHQAGALAIASCDPIALALLEPPGRGDAAADIVVGEGLCLGNYPSLGGPALGYFACSEALLRRMPGRIAAETVDKQGRRGYVLTLQTREQHIRREKATSNICTNQGLLALRATVYLGLLGREGLIEVANLCVQKTHHAAQLAEAIPGYRLAYPGSFFREFVLECPVDASAIVTLGRTEGVLPGID